MSEIRIRLRPGDREELERWVRARKTLRRRVERARIVLGSVDGLSARALRLRVPPAVTLPVRGLLSPLLVGLVFAGFGSGASAAQRSEDVVIPDDPSPPYIIDMQPGPILEGGTLDEDDWVSSFGGMEVLADGRFLLWELIADRFLVASPDLPDRRWIGREGEGPGEYRGVRWVRSHGNRLHVFDVHNLRRTVLDAESFETLHTNSLGLYGNYCCDAAVLDDSSYVISAMSYLPERVGYALHRFDGDGTVGVSFDEVSVGTVPADQSYRWLDPASRSGHVWSASFYEYRIDLWDAVEGKRSRSVTREAEWVLPRHVRETWEAGKPGLLMVTGVAEDPQGRLWVILRVPTQSPPPAACFELVSNQAREGPTYTTREACKPLYYTRVEVLDPWAGRVLAAWNAPAELSRDLVPSGVMDDGTLYSLGRTTLGFPTVRLWNSTLKPR